MINFKEILGLDPESGEKPNLLGAALPAGLDAASQLFKDHSQDVEAYNTGDFVDVGAIANQEFTAGKGFRLGSTLSGAASGASVAGVPGAIAGGVVGLAGDVLNFFNRRSAARQFEEDRARQLRDGIQFNTNVQAARRADELAAFSGINQYRNFFG